MYSLKPNEQRAKNAISLIWVVLIVEIANLVSSYLQYELLQAASRGVSISNEAANTNDFRESVFGILYLVVFIVSVVTFILWFRRAYYNLHQKVNHLEFTENWAALAWFVPIICLFRPYQIMKELYGETKALLIKNGDVVSEKYSTTYLGWWWAIWIFSNLIGQVIIRYSRNATSIDESITSTMLNIFQNIIGIPLAIITVKVIKDYHQLEVLLAEMKEPEAFVINEAETELGVADE